MSNWTERNIRRAAELLSKAAGLVITAGAGMGVDSGLPSFRGRHGFWRAYPALGRRGISFEQMAQPRWFFEEPAMAWAFYGHRHQLYRQATPHEGFRLLRDWVRAMPAGHFVVTSNVDEQFQAAGFPDDGILELHGSMFSHQCVVPCCDTTWRAGDLPRVIDANAMRAIGELPSCPHCGGLARPNVLMFEDVDWIAEVQQRQYDRYRHWLAGLGGRRAVVMELGAGTAIPSIRRLGEGLAARGRATLVRINPDATEGEEESTIVPIRMGALEALVRVGKALPESFRAAGASA